MMRALFIFVAILLTATAVVYVSERSTAHARIANNQFVWFAAVKYRSPASKSAFSDEGDRIEWRSRADTVLVGDGPPYWDEFFVLGGTDPTAHPSLPFSVADAYVVRIEPTRLPLLLSGTFSMLHRLGIWRKPDVAIDESASEAGFGESLGPSPESVAILKSRPAEQQPAMVNFLQHFDIAQYESSEEGMVSGRQAYGRYGSVAFRTVYRLGGQLVTSGTVVEVVREAEAGPTRGEWSDIAIMQYPTQQAILSLQNAPEYREALAHRNAGLERTRIVASVAF